MPPRILIFVGAGGDAASAARDAACHMAPAGSAARVCVEGSESDDAVRRLGDRLAGGLGLRTVARELAALARIVDLVRERADRTVAIAVPSGDALVRLVEASDLARAIIDEGRPPAGASTLAAQRARDTQTELATLRLAAAAGDLLRAPELTTVGLTRPAPSAVADRDAAESGAERDDHLTTRTALTLAGLAVLEAPLPDDAAQAALLVLAGSGPGRRDAAPVAVATPRGATLTLALPSVPDDLRAVRTGQELALHAAGAARRLRAPVALGGLEPSDVVVDERGSVVLAFDPPDPAEAA